MKKFALLIPLTALALINQGCVVFALRNGAHQISSSIRHTRNQVIGTGPVVNQGPKSLQAFNRIDIGTACKVKYIVSNESSYTISAQREILPKISVTVEDGELQISTSGNWSTDKDVTLTIKGRQLTEIKQSSSSTLTMDKIDTDSLELEVEGASKSFLSGKVSNFTANTSGAATVTLNFPKLDQLNLESDGASNIEFTGKVTSVDLDLSGASTFKGLDTNFENVKFNLDGASNAVFNAFGRVTGSADGASFVQVGGKPSSHETDANGASTIQFSSKG